MDRIQGVMAGMAMAAVCAGLAGGALAQARSQPVAAPTELDACRGGDARACRALDANPSLRWGDGHLEGLDDWNTGHARGTAPSSPGDIVARVLAACDAGDVRACAAYAGAVDRWRGSHGDPHVNESGRQKKS